MTLRHSLTALAIAAFATAGHADEVTETIDSALKAYEAGDIQDALEELAYATQLIRQIKTTGLTDFLPPAPEGWTREIDTDMSAGMAMMGGGVGAEATYEGDGQKFTITMMADNPMVQGFAGMMANAGLLPGIKRIRVGREKFIDQKGEIVGLIENRVLIQASGADTDIIVSLLEQIDFEALGRYGR